MFLSVEALEEASRCFILITFEIDNLPDTPTLSPGALALLAFALALMAVLRLRAGAGRRRA